MVDVEDKRLSYAIWEKQDTCPHCGSDMVEIAISSDGEHEYFDCLNCDQTSGYDIQPELTDEERLNDERVENEIYEYLQGEK